MKVQRWMTAAVAALLLTTLARADDKKLVVWDGDALAEGGGWAAPEAATNAVKVSDNGPKVTVDGKEKQLKAVLFTGVVDASTWTGFGWNWHTWWPEDSGDDITPWKNLVLKMKVSFKNGKEPSGLQLWLSSNKGADKNAKKEGEKVSVADYAKDLMDGEWHDVVIPLDKLKGPDLLGTKVWELDMGSWADHAQDFSIAIGSISFDNR